MFEEFYQTRTLKFDMITTLVWNERDFMFTIKLNTEKMKDGVLTTPKPHLLLISIPSVVSTSRLRTQSIIKKLSISELSMTLKRNNQ